MTLIFPPDEPVADISVRQFIDDHEMGIEASVVESNPWSQSFNEMPGATHYHVVIAGKFEGVWGSYTTYFSMGSALHHMPTLTDLLDCIASDCASIENADGYNDWCRELGYEPGMADNAHEIYRITVENRDLIIDFMGQEAYEQLLYNVEF